MATRRRGGADLDDLKARLGFTEGASASGEGGEPSGEVEAAPADAGIPDATDAIEGVADASSTAPSTPVSPAAPVSIASPRPAPAPSASAAPAARPSPFGDLSAPPSRAPSQTASPDAVTLDPNAIEPGLKAPGAGFALPLVLAAIASLLAGLFLGSFASSANGARGLVNAQTTGAQTLLTMVEPAGNRIAELSTTIAGIDTNAGYPEAFDQALRSTWGENAPVLDPTVLTQAGPLLTHDPDLSRQLIAFAIRTQYLQSMVGNLLRRTDADMPEIRRELEAGSQVRGTGIAFPLFAMIDAYNAWQANPTGPYMPPDSERVEFDNLELVEVPNEADPTQPFRVYNVFNTRGETIQIPPHDLLILPRAQLLPAVTTETPLSRYRSRVEQIRDEVAQVTADQSTLAEGLREVAQRPLLFTF